MSTLDIAVVMLGVNSALSTWVLLCVVRRVSPHPRKPVQGQARKSAAASSVVPPGGVS